MNKEEKELLIKDLCGRLPYGVKIFRTTFPGFDKIYYLKEIRREEYLVSAAAIINNKEDEILLPIGLALPYLFPLWRMTKKQKEEFDALYWEAREKTCTDFEFKCVYSGLKSDWLNKNHFDYRGLIRKGLAIDCTDIDVY